MERFERRLAQMTSLVNAEYTVNGQKKAIQASGFYYTKQTPTEPEKKSRQWMKLDDFWFITNRHVVLPKEIDNEGRFKEYHLDFIEFGLRQEMSDGSIEWYPIRLSEEELYDKLKVHSDDYVDVVAIDITTNINRIFKDIVEKKINKNIGIPSAISNMDLPENKPIQVEITSDIVVASYPRGFYDEKNKFPIVKSGIIASAWGCDFKGKPIFEIDAQLFPGSSGGVVISKPSMFAVNEEGQILQNRYGKDFILLGIYSGEYVFRELTILDGKQIEVIKSYGLGNVWYYYLILEVIEKGVKVG